MTDPTYTRIQLIVGVIAVAALCLSLYLGFQEPGTGFNRCDPVKVKQAFVLGGWVFLPPTWFWVEYHLLFRHLASRAEKSKKSGKLENPETPELKLEHFKYGQDVSSKIWLALVTLLLGLYFGHDLVHEAQNSNNPAKETSCAEHKSIGIDAGHPETKNGDR